MTTETQNQCLSIIVLQTSIYADVMEVKISNYG